MYIKLHIIITPIPRIISMSAMSTKSPYIGLISRSLLNPSSSAPEVKNSHNATNTHEKNAKIAQIATIDCIKLTPAAAILDTKTIKNDITPPPIKGKGRVPVSNPSSLSSSSSLSPPSLS